MCSSSLLLFVSTLWQLFASRDKPLASTWGKSLQSHHSLILIHAESAPQILWLRLFLLLAIPAVAVYAALSLDYSSGEGLFTMLLNCVMHMIDVTSLVFGDTQLSIETWG